MVFSLYFCLTARFFLLTFLPASLEGSKALWLILRFASWQKPLHYHILAERNKNQNDNLFRHGQLLPLCPHSWVPWAQAALHWGAQWCRRGRKRGSSLCAMQVSCHGERGTAEVPWGTRCPDITDKPEGIWKQTDASAPTNLKLPDKKLPVITNNVIFMQRSLRTSSVLTTKRNNKSHKQLPN